MSSIPYGVLAVGIIAYCVCGKKTHPGVIVFLVVLIMGIGSLAEGFHLFDSAKRFQAYNAFMGVWLQSDFTWFGTGPGTFIALSKEIQKSTGFDVLPDGHMYAWKWMHSDILQTIFEWGWVGAILWIAVLVEIFYKLYARKECTVFAIAGGLLAFACFDYPARYGMTAFLIAYSAAHAYTALNGTPQNKSTREI